MFQFLWRPIYPAILCFVLSGAWALAAENVPREDPSEDPLLGKALSTLFSPRHAPASKTMGLLQRNFLDLADQSRKKLEVALVIDGTASMGDQLLTVRKSIKALMQDLELYKQTEIGYQIVVFRDSGSPSGEIQFPLQSKNNRFVHNRDSVVSAIQSIQAESGAPYFLELIDKGVHAALADLQWSSDNDTSRWIFIFGDAPPYAENFNEPANRANRRFATNKLVSLAVERKVRINCILCKSRPEDLDVYRQVLDRTRLFMNTLSTETEGLMLDLSYKDIRDAIRKSAPVQTIEYQHVDLIEFEDIRRARELLTQKGSMMSGKRRILMAALPHLPLDNMSFEPHQAGVQLSTELRLRLRTIPEVDFKDPVTVRDRFELLSRRGLRGDALLQMLARALNVDYLLWGTLEPSGGVVVAKTGIYERTSGQRVLEVRIPSNISTRPEEFGRLLAERLVHSEIATATTNRRLKTAFASLASTDSQLRRMLQPVSTGSAQSPLLIGLEALEQSLAFPVGAPEAAPLLESASENLRQAIALDDESALGHFLLANCHYNQARTRKQQQDIEGARQNVKAFATHLREAFGNAKNPTVNPSLRMEIEADYTLLVRGDVDKAISAYRRLLEEQGSFDMRAARRAYWMLAGIYSGDWGVDEKYVNSSELKSCLIQILAIWPDSHEAKFINQVLRWDPVEKKTRFQFFPRENGDVNAWGDLDL